MNKVPRITVVTVAFNAEDTIEDTLRSVAEQDYPQIEHIVVDGASSDGTMQIVNRYRHKLAAVVSEPDRGTYDAMNKGLALAKGDIVGFLNADDVFADRTVLQQVARAFDDERVEISYADLVYVKKENLNTTVRFWRSAPFKKGAFERGWCPPHPTFYARRTLYEKLGKFDLSYRLAADADLMIRFLASGRLCSVYVSQVWVRMRVGGQTNLSVSNIIRQNREILRSLKQHGIPANPLVFAVSKLFSRIAQVRARNNV